MIKIILIDDDKNDVELASEIFREIGVHEEVEVLSDSEDALSYLFREGKYENRSTIYPFLILLDLKMPKISGLEILAKIKADSKFRLIPVVIFTSSREERDLHSAFDLGANAYIVKPVEYHRFRKVLRSAIKFWRDANHIPPNMEF